MSKKSEKRKLKKRKAKEELFKNAKFNLVDRTKKQSNNFVLSGHIYTHPGSSFVYINRWAIHKTELAKFNIPVKKGILVSLLVQRILTYSNRLIIIDKIDDNLRYSSDMRNKPEWRKLQWLEPAIEALYKQRDELIQQTGIRYEVDHIHPITHSRLCGLTVPWNLQVIPATENRRKSNKLI